MANNGDLNLARQLQAEFGRAKEPKRKGRRAGGAGYGDSQAAPKRQYQPPQPPQFGRQNERTISDQGRSRNRGRRGPSSTVNHLRPAWQGKLVTNDSPGNNRISLHTAEADMFFHNYHRPLPSSPPPTVPQATTHSALNLQQQGGQQSMLNNMPYFSNPPNNNGIGAFGMPLHQRTNQVLPKAPLNTISSAPMVTLDRGELLHAQQKEQEDIEMGDADCLLNPAPKPATANAPKGLSSSMWNPANENARADSVDSSQPPFKPRSSTPLSAKKVEIVTSGLTKGPGLKASR
ncbi:hypothetical protein F5B21DRAFT_471028 [Xylaria acuta]|nr:hypothetical protein F5B21DRAFT_471028 [Xylaria acuta]